MQDRTRNNIRVNLTRWLRLGAIAATRLVVQTARVLPIKSNRIAFVSHRRGSQYADSPRCISEYLESNYPGCFEIVWRCDDPARFPELESRGIKLVKYRSFSDFVFTNTAKVTISNLFGPTPWIIRRRGKLNVETSHGVAYKSLLSSKVNAGKVGLPEIAPMRWNIGSSTICMSGNSILTESVYRKELGYRGEILEVGLPRNDVFFTDCKAEENRVREYYGLEEGTRIALVMPTWRKDQSRANVELDYGLLVRELSSAYGGKWFVLLRLHHLSTIDISDILARHEDCVVDATQYPASQDLLCTGDLLITDYSSCMWDFALRKKPILIYAPDMDDYREGRGFNVPPEEWGLVQCKDQDELGEAIRSHSYQGLCEASQAHLERFGSCETGQATRAICERIASFCNVGAES